MLRCRDNLKLTLLPPPPLISVLIFKGSRQNVNSCDFVSEVLNQETFYADVYFGTDGRHTEAEVFSRTQSCSVLRLHSFLRYFLTDTLVMACMGVTMSIILLKVPPVSIVSKNLLCFSIRRRIERFYSF